MFNMYPSLIEIGSKEQGKIQIGKVSKNKNTNKPHSHSAEINK